MLRKAAVAGRFYPANEKTLRSDLANYLGPTQERVKAKGIVVPHAGYVYSGHVAGAVYARIEPAERAIVLCPNHTGLGAPLSIMSSGEWEIPLGKISIDSELAGRLMHHCYLLTEDAEAHRLEHALEVQLPFLHFLRGDFKFVPIAIRAGGYASLERLGKAIAETLLEMNGDVLVIASSDMNHYESDEVTRTKDRKAIDKILDLDPKGLYQVIKSESVSMCGYGPTIAMLYGVTSGGYVHSELIRYATSGDVSGNTEEVVGYAGIVIH